MIVVVITASRQRLEAGGRARGAGRPGARRLGARVPRGDASSDGGPSPSVLRRAFEDPGLTARERCFLESCARRSPSVAATRRPSSTSAAPPGCSARRAGRSSRRASGCSRCSSDARPCSGCCRRRSTRTAPSSASAPSSRARSSAARRYVGATYGLPNRSLGPSGCSGRCGWTTTRRSGRFGRRRSSSPGSSRRLRSRV